MSELSLSLLEEYKVSGDASPETIKAMEVAEHWATLARSLSSAVLVLSERRKRRQRFVC